ncbi:MAG: glycosyltransferase family 2 protein [Gemmatimonadota bacterium]
MIYVAIPVHNEQHTIGVLLWRIRAVLTEAGRDFRILVADDASTDETADVLEPYRRVLPLTVFRHERRRGYAASLERLLREAVARSEYPRRDAVLVLQADFTDGPEAIPEMVRRFQGGADLIAGVASPDGAMPRTVRIARRGAWMLSRGLPFPGEIEDPFCGFRLYRLMTLKKALGAAPADDGRFLRHDGWAANAELLLTTRPYVRRAEQVEFRSDYDRRYRESRFRVFPELWSVFRAVRDRRLRDAAVSPT